MTRRTFAAFGAWITVSLTLASCGDKIPADRVKSFDDKYDEVVKVVEEAKTKLNDVTGKFTSVPKDSTKKAELDAIEAELKSDETQIGEIEKSLNDLKSTKDAVASAGKNSEYTKMADTAMPALDALKGKAAGVSTSLDALSARLAALGAGHGATAAGGQGSESGAAGSGTSATGGSGKTTAGGSASGGHEGSSTGHAVGSSTRKESATNEGEASGSILRPNTNPGDRSKPPVPVGGKVILKPNKNP